MKKCICRAYPFPHRPGGGQCNGDGDGDDTTPVCRDCGSTAVRYRAGYHGELEPDEPSATYCGYCDSEDLAASLIQWDTNYTARDAEYDAAEARADLMDLFEGCPEKYHLPVRKR